MIHLLAYLTFITVCGFIGAVCLHAGATEPRHPRLRVSSRGREAAVVDLNKNEAGN